MAEFLGFGQEPYQTLPWAERDDRLVSTVRGPSDVIPSPAPGPSPSPVPKPRPIPRPPVRPMPIISPIDRRIVKPGPGPIPGPQPIDQRQQQEKQLPGVSFAQGDRYDFERLYQQGPIPRIWPCTYTPKKVMPRPTKGQGGGGVVLGGIVGEFLSRHRVAIATVLLVGAVGTAAYFYVK